MCARPLYIHRDRDGAEKAGKLDNCSPTSTRSQATRARLPYLPLPIPIPIPMSIHGRAIQTDTLPAQRSMTSPSFPPSRFSLLCHIKTSETRISRTTPRPEGEEPNRSKTEHHFPSFRKEGTHIPCKAVVTTIATNPAYTRPRVRVRAYLGCCGTCQQSFCLSSPRCGTIRCATLLRTTILPHSKAGSRDATSSLS